MRLKIYLLLMFLAILAAAQLVYATPAELNVRVADQQGNIVQDATVLLVNGTALVAEAATNSSGWASFLIEVGGEVKYLLIVEFSNVIAFSNMSLSPGQTVYVMLNASKLFPLDVESEGVENVEFQANLTSNGAYGIRNYTTNVVFYGDNEASATFVFPEEIWFDSKKYELKNVTIEMYGAKFILKKPRIEVEFGNQSGDAYKISVEYVEISPAPPAGDLLVSVSCLAVSVAALIAFTASLIKKKPLMKSILARRKRVLRELN
ncbi:MAG: hypothetical protein DRJ38_01955 [Thermoprotei archaeon]|nr:MAG: hypothetical protein DRJ38_01955 [Thermoprotei archaeon]